METSVLVANCETSSSIGHTSAHGLYAHVELERLVRASQLERTAEVPLLRVYTVSGDTVVLPPARTGHNIRLETADVNERHVSDFFKSNEFAALARVQELLQLVFLNPFELEEARYANRKAVSMISVLVSYRLNPYRVTHFYAHQSNKGDEQYLGSPTLESVTGPLNNAGGLFLVRCEHVRMVGANNTERAVYN